MLDKTIISATISRIWGVIRAWAGRPEAAGEIGIDNSGFDPAGLAGAATDVQEAIASINGWSLYWTDNGDSTITYGGTTLRDGAGNTSATYRAEFQNGDGDNLLALRDDGNAVIGLPSYSFTFNGASTSQRMIIDQNIFDLHTAGNVNNAVFRFKGVFSGTGAIQFSPGGAIGYKPFLLGYGNLFHETATSYTSLKAASAWTSAVTNLDGGDLWLDGGDPTPASAGVYGNVLIAQNGGNVGIGTTTASTTAKAHIVGAGNTSETYTTKDQNSDGDLISASRDDGYHFTRINSAAPSSVPDNMGAMYRDGGQVKIDIADDLGVVTTYTLG